MGKVLYIILAIIASLAILFLDLSGRLKIFICLAFVILGCVVRSYDRKKEKNSD